MKKLHASLGVLLAGCLAAAQNTPEPRALMVGTYDSRAVAIAYVRSAEFNEYLAAQQADVARASERARAEGDASLAAALDALGPAMQKRTHEQGFGTAPVDDILARIEDRIPAIAAEAGVDLIVSKWVLTYRDPDAATVDVTDLLAAEFNPDEKTLKVISEIVRTEPVAADMLDHEH